MNEASGQAALWFTVVALGVYHGLNPAMGWPLAVANGLSARRSGAVFATLLPLGAGHLLAMAIVLVPFVALTWYSRWSVAIRIGAGLLVLLFGVYKLIDRRHPRFLARVRPSQLAWWSFLMATAHGAGLMLVPVALSLYVPAADSSGLMRSGVVTAVAVSVVHTVAMCLSGVAIAWVVYRYLGLEFLRRAWLNLDVVWAVSLVVAGAAGCATALWARPH